MYVSFWSKVLLNQAPSVCKSIFGKLVCALVGSKIISSSQGDKALSEFTSFHESSMSEKRLAFEKFDRHEQRLYEFFLKQTGIVSYTSLLSILKLVLVLSHSQANVERCFSVNNSVLKCNMSEKSIMSRKLIIDHMKSHNLLPVFPHYKEPSTVCSIFPTTLWTVHSRSRRIQTPKWENWTVENLG